MMYQMKIEQTIEAINTLKENFRLGIISYKEFTYEADSLYCTLHSLQAKRDAYMTKIYNMEV